MVIDLHNKKYSFAEEQQKLFSKFMQDQNRLLKNKDALKIDLHCHDYNSDVPDELLGRILNVPETWLSTGDLIKGLKEKGCDTYTITNHNNARSCYDLQDRGFDVLTGAEFTCHVPDFQTSIHVLTYGFEREQEETLNSLRSDLYRFMDYTSENNIPTIWAHPLYYYSKKGTPQIEFFEKLSLVFERFEVINGQRNTWQNLLIKDWIDHLDEENILMLSKKHNLSPDRYCRNPYKKSFSGGSDCHIGIFSGLTGTHLIVDNLQEQLKIKTKSQIALDALRAGNMVPYGSPNENEKLSAAFLDYFCQLGMNMSDPGMLRVLLHKGTPKDKLLSLFIANGFLELRKHKKAMRFIEILHDAFNGKLPLLTAKFLIKKDYLNIFENVKKIATTRKNTPGDVGSVFQSSVEQVYSDLNKIFIKKLNKKIKKFEEKYSENKIDIKEFIKNLELPVEIRKYTGGGKAVNGPHFNINEILDDLSFPLISSILVYASSFTSTKVLYNNRKLLEEFSNKTGTLKHPKRMLWITDTFFDRNGVSISLQEIHHYVKENNLPIDFLVCHGDPVEDQNIITVKPIFEFTPPMYSHQKIAIPDLLKIHELFRKNEYDRIMCSTEGPMGIIAQILKSAYNVPAFFMLHTDWITFIKKTLRLDIHMVDRIRRFLRAFYKNFDGIMVLNDDQAKWLNGKEMGFKKENIHKFAHWCLDHFKAEIDIRQELFDTDNKILLFAGRVSREKGIDDLINVYNITKKAVPDLTLVVCGDGPDLKYLKKEIPDAFFTGWIEQNNLSKIYSSADLMILPSKFDTFGKVILEAHTCGLPVISYTTKGPKDIIQHGKNGYLASGLKDMTDKIIDHFSESDHFAMKEQCLISSNKYDKELIMRDFLINTGLEEFIPAPEQNISTAKITHEEPVSV